MERNRHHAQEGTGVPSETPAVTHLGARAGARLEQLRALRSALAELSLAVPDDRVRAAKIERDAIVHQLDELLIPRLSELSAPLVAVVAGSTGAGKSTLVNSILSQEVTPSGVLRPTTKRPVALFHPADADEARAHPLIAPDVVEQVPSDAMPRGLILIDAPDLDSVDLENHALAQRLLESADLWLFVTTANRYGDDLPWHVVQGAGEQGRSVAVVLNRIAPQSIGVIRADLLARLRDAGLTSVPLFVVPESAREGGLLPVGVVLKMRQWLTHVVSSGASRSVIARSVEGALAALPARVDVVADAVSLESDLLTVVDKATGNAIERVRREMPEAVRANGLPDASVESRWHAATAGALAKVLKGDGAVPKIKGSSRSGAARGSELFPLRLACVTVAESFLAKTLRDARQAVDSAWANIDIRPDRHAPSAVKDREFRDEAGDWATRVERMVEERLNPIGGGAGGDVKRLRQARTAVGPDGMAAIVIAAALEPPGAGSVGSVSFLRRLVPDDADQLVSATREDLLARADRMCERERAHYESQLSEWVEDSADLDAARAAITQGTKT